MASFRAHVGVSSLVLSLSLWLYLCLNPKEQTQTPPCFSFSLSLSFSFSFSSLLLCASVQLFPVFCHPLFFHGFFFLFRHSHCRIQLDRSERRHARDAVSVYVFDVSELKDQASMITNDDVILLKVSKCVSCCARGSLFRYLLCVSDCPRCRSAGITTQRGE